jgi:hypothetical protein
MQVWIGMVYTLRVSCIRINQGAPEDHTTCTADAPDVVFTVRMYDTRPLYGLA